MKIIYNIIRYFVNKMVKDKIDGESFLSVKNDVDVSHSIDECEQIVFINIDRLLSPLGEFHWRGWKHPDKIYLGEDFHSNEQGDATLHTGVLLKSLAWKFKNINSSNDITLGYIDKALSYYELHQKYNHGGLGRNFVKDEYYHLFPEGEKDGDRMSYRLCDNGYWQRYDISIDAMIHAVSGLYWVYKFVPQYKERAYNILYNQLGFYEKNNWKIKSDLGKEVRYGDHNEKFNLFTNCLKHILYKVIKGKDKLSLLDRLQLNHAPSFIYGSKMNYFNTLMDTALILMLHDLGIDMTKRCELMYEQLKKLDNFYFNSVYKFITGKDCKTIQDEARWALNYGHTSGRKYLGKEVPMQFRRGYFKWEFHPDYYYTLKTNQEIVGNIDFLLPYWIR